MASTLDGAPVSTRRTALILYGTETGNSEECAGELGRMLERLHFTADVTEMDNVEIVCLPRNVSKSFCSVSLIVCLFIEYPTSIYYRRFRSLYDWTRGVPTKCEEILEESSQKETATRMSGQNEVYHIWTGR